MALVVFIFTIPAHAACTIELATFRDRDDIASIEFRPREPAAAITNSFRLLLPNDVVLDGIVMWSEGVARPNGVLMHQCPEGDVTGAEIEACTVWQGVVYSVGEAGEVGLLPAEATPAPKRLIFPDLAYAISISPAAERLPAGVAPWDVFELSGCQE